MDGRKKNLSPPPLLAFFFFFFFAFFAKAFDLSTLSFDEGYVPLFGDGNLVRSDDGKSVRLLLTRYSGSGFISSDMYQYGIFSASIKLPSEYTAGIVVAFYTSNGDVFEKSHDELDFEFLGNVLGKPWRVQTNIYGNGSTGRGREERYFLPFDPTKNFHRYTIVWTDDSIIFYIDEIPIREVKRSDEVGGDYPSKPMSLYATIWDASNWATSGGKYKVNYAFSPFVSEFADLTLVGCRSEPVPKFPSPYAEQCTSADDEIEVSGLTIMTPEKVRAMREFRSQYMTYSVCYDTNRYPVPLPGCEVLETLRARFSENGHLKYVNTPRVVRLRRRRAAKRRSRVRESYDAN